MKIGRYIWNRELPIIKKEWKGNPITTKGLFLNHEYPYIPKFSNMLKWKFREGNNTKQKKQDKFRLTPEYPTEFFNSNRDGIVWLGHASFLIRIEGKTILIDPIFESPAFFMERFVSFPFKYNLLQGLDLILISHDHRDHLDERSLKNICLLNPQAKVLTGLNMAPIISSWVPNHVIESGWFQEYPKIESLEIFFLPTRHWSKRNFKDTNQRLWGSFYIKSENKSIYFGGDSGYGNHYNEIGDLFGQLDYAILGIGAYKPEWFMHPSHTSPKEALKAAADLNAKNFIPMHYGTFDLSDETIGEPLRNLRESYNSQSKSLALLDKNPGSFISL